MKTRMVILWRVQQIWHVTYTIIAISYINRDYRSVKTNCIYWLRVLIILLRKRGNWRLNLVLLKLLVEETGVPRENHIPAASSQWLILSRLLITSLVSSVYGFWLPLWYLRCTDYDYLFGIFGIRIMITSLVSSVYGFWLPLWYLRCTDSDTAILPLIRSVVLAGLSQ